MSQSNAAKQWLTVAAFFFADGFIFGAWASRIPLITDRLDLSEGQVGVLLLLLAAGGVAAMMTTPALLRTVTPRRASSWIVLTISALFIPPYVAPTYLSAALAVFLFGACNGSLNVTANADAAETERHCEKAWMSGFHGTFSVGGLAGAVVSSFLIFDDHHSITPVILLSLISGLTFLPTLFVSPTPRRQQGSPTEPNDNQQAVSLALLASLAFVCLVSEGAMADWTALLMTESGASIQLSSFGYGAFAAGMAALRFSGDWLTVKFGRIQLIFIGAVIATLGLFTALVAMNAYALLIGFFFVGAGLANVVPVLFRAAARSSAKTLAMTTAFGYGGFLIGPVAVGGLAEVYSLRAAMFVVVICCGMIAMVSLKMPSKQS